MNTVFNESQKNEIIKKRGNEFYIKILSHIDIYSQKWGLTDFEFGTLSSHNFILFCKSGLYGDCVLKLYGLMREYNALCEYSNSEKFCKVYEFDLETQAMLIERIIPGNMLKDEPSLEKRLAAFSMLFNGMHIEPKNPEKYVTYMKLLSDVIEAMKTYEGNKELYAYALRAKEVYLDVTSVYDKNVLIHWDLQYNNILLSEGGKYKIIDPFGFISDPVMEIGRYILNEYWDTVSENRSEIVDEISDYFEINLNIPKYISKQCFYIDVVFLNCHFAERGGTVNMDDVKFAETILNNIR